MKRPTARSLQVHPWPDGPAPDWATTFGHPRLGPTDRQWRCVAADGAPVGGLVARWLVDRWSLTIELADGRVEAATRLLHHALADLRGPTALVASDDDPIVPHEVLGALGFARTRRLIVFERALSSADLAPSLPLEPLTDPPPADACALIASCAGQSEPGATSWARWKADAAWAFDASAWSVARADGRPVGVVLPQRDPLRADVGAMAFVGVDPAARGRGLGARLHEAGLQALAARGVRHYVDATEVDNAPMQRVFARNGCAPTGRWSTWTRQR